MKKATLYFLIAMIILIAALPLIISGITGNGAEFEGADGQAEDVIAEIAPDYEPWFESLYEPASGEIESLLFALQAAIGAALIGYYLGSRGRLKTTKANVD